MAASWFRLPALARRFGRVFAASLLLTMCFVVLTTGPVRACDVLDPTCVVEAVDDTVDGATETVDDTVEGATETVEDTVEETTGDAEETVEETAETVEETVESVTGDAGETVEETGAAGIGSVDDAIDGSSQPPLPGTGPVPPVVDPAPSGGNGAGNGSVGDGSGGGDGPIGAPPGGVVGPFVLDPQAVGSGLVNETVPAPRGFLGGLAGPAAEIASRIAFPLALAVLVLLFIAFQNRLDRRDPKLALAATSPDVLRFA
jgi:vacuolar-type H+-ATPase subunit H/uncharacterized membrane protein YtjA (UPF0391 family)